MSEQDTRREGRDLTQDEIRVQHLDAYLERCRENMQEVRNRVKKARNVIGIGTVRDHVIVLDVNQAEALVERIENLRAAHRAESEWENEGGQP